MSPTKNKSKSVSSKGNVSQGYDPKLTLRELANTISELGIKKANTKVWQLFVLGILAGLYIGFGGHLFLVALQQGMGKVVGGAVFSVGLVLVVVAGAELFTGNIIMIVGAITCLFSCRKIAKNWITVYVGNFVGSYLFAVVMWKTGLLGKSPDQLNELGKLAVSVATGKLALTFTEAFTRGVFCNMLVILAIIMSAMSKDVISKIFCCILPIMTFVASGFEHCVANMYLIPIGLFAKGEPFWRHASMFHNLIPVTLGNILGGVLILTVHPNRIRQIMHLSKRRKQLTQKR